MSRQPQFRIAPLLVLLLGLWSWPVAVHAQYNAAIPPEPAAENAPAATGGPRLVGTYPLPGDAVTGQIVFYFDEPLAPVGDPSTLIALSPALPGTWSQGAQYVAFQTSSAQGRDKQFYVATFLPALQGVNGLPVVSPEDGIVFGNYELDLEGVAYGRITMESADIQITLTTPVSWEQLTQHLTITDAQGTQVPFTSPRRGSAARHIVTVPVLATAPYTVTLSPGLTDSTGRLQSEQPFRHALPSLGNFTLSGLSWAHDDEEYDRLELKTSYPVPAARLLGNLQVFIGNSDVPATLEPADTSDTSKLAYRIRRPEGSYETLKYVFTPVLDGIPALYHQEAQQGSLSLKRSPLQIEYHNWYAEGIKPIRLQLYFNGTVSAEKLREHVSVAPAVANFSVEAGEYGTVDLLGDWKYDQRYTVTVTKGMVDQSDQFGVNTTLAWNAGNPPKMGGIGFAFEGSYYFPRRQAGAMTLYARNVEKAKVRVYQLFPNNLARALDEIQQGKSPESFGYDLSRKVAERDVDFPASNGDQVETVVPVQEMMPPDLKGIFGLSLSPGYDYYNTKVMVWTDIGVLAHWQDDHVLVYAHNLWDLTPLADARVTLYSAKHQAMGEAQTGPDGVARVGGWDPELGRAKVVVVETANDYTFLPLYGRGEDPVAFDSAMPGYSAEGYDAFLYTDRNLYRPGEPVHVRWLVRQADGSPLTGAPLQLRLVDPRETSRDFTSELSAWGSGSLDIDTAQDWFTGAYRVELWVPGADTALTTQTINLEDFVPNRISVDVATSSPYWSPGDEHRITVTGTQLSGGPAGERKASAALILAKNPWKPEAWRDYTFTNDAVYNGDVRELGEAQTDGTGTAEFSFTWTPAKDMSYPIEAVVRGEVFELGGRSVASRTSAFLFPSPQIVGLAVANGAAPGSVDVSVVAVQPDGSPAAVESVKVLLERQQWSYYVRRYTSHNEPNWSEAFVPLKTETLALAGGKGTVNLSVPDGYGTYRVKVYRDDAPQYATQTFWSYHGQANLVDASRPSLITMAADATSYNIGGIATVRIDSPFDGNAIVVVQGAQIEQAITVPISGGSGSFTLPLEARHYPNIWLEATVIHPVEPGSPLTYPYSSFTMINIPVNDPAKALQVAFPALPDEIRPMSQLDVTVQVSNAAGAPVASEVTLALVDEGIHQILRYQNPDPVAWFRRDRRPDYRRAHYYDQVAYDFQPARIGGDELLRKRLGEDDATVDDNWIKPLALWSGTVETDASGAAVISMAIPEFAGKVRLVAVATTGSEAGSGAANVTIRRPVILQTTLPRFVGPGDTFSATVLIQNKRDTALRTTVKAVADTPLAMAPFEQSWDLEPQGEAVVMLPMEAGELTGSGVIHWSMTTTAPDGSVIDEYQTETPLKVQSPSVYQVRSEMAVLAPGEQRSFANTDFRDNDVLTAKIFVTPDPLVRVRKALDYVVGYPYGCVEQTTSRCLPLFLLGQAAARTGDIWEAAYLQQFIQAGIDRLFSMQTRSGGLGYWPGARDPNPYGSVYAAHFLTLAKGDPAFTLPERAYEQLMTYIRERIPLRPKDGAHTVYQYAYACYVRALSGDATVMEDINRLDTVPVSTATRQWLALAALTLSGGTDEAQRYLLLHPSHLDNEREQGDTLNSEIRNDAITLMTQMALGLGAGVVQPQAEKLLNHLEAHRYSTHEAAFLITALVEYLKTTAGDLSQSRASITGRSGTQEQTGNFQFSDRHVGAGEPFSISNLGPTPLYIHFSTEGILKVPDVSESFNGITIKRSLEGKAGAVAPDALKHGENYLVTVEITCSQDFKNLVVADLLPGGLEIENPRLDGTAMAAWKKSGAVIPSFLEMRDDRLIAAFNQLERGTHRFYYAVRAVTPGTFFRPGANAECMYDLKYNGRTAGEQVTIVP